MHRKIMTLFHYLKHKNIIGVKDIIPAYTTITVVYDIMTIKKQAAKAPHIFLKEEMEKAIAGYVEESFIQRSKKIIPVCYDITLGIDLEKISKQKNLPVDEVISIHNSKLYNVYMIGFLPGFAYMGFVDDSIATPRLNKPRINVQAGSVGIAGNQTGIYPLDSPGGWNIIGQTPLKLFNVADENPCLLQPGDTVKFVAISLDEFNQQKRS